jgi:hypothetical protein
VSINEEFKFVLFIRGNDLWSDAFFAFWGKAIIGLIAVVTLALLIDSAV